MLTALRGADQPARLAEIRAAVSDLCQQFPVPATDAAAV
jgi:hypothetical protein